MTKITLDIKKSIEQNAAVYFEKAKKARKKLEGAKKALKKIQNKLELLKEKKNKFFSSEGFLCIGGRDATTNDIIIKKYTDKNDIVFHTDMAGSPFFVVKANNKKISPKTMEEAAQATASYSRAWRLGLSSLEVFYVKPEQLTKEARSGEYLGKGAFMVKGKTNYLHPMLEIAVGIKENRIIGGPINAIKVNSEKFIIIKQGKEKTSEIAKKIKKIIGGSIDEITLFIPAGGSRIKKTK